MLRCRQRRILIVSESSLEASPSVRRRQQLRRSETFPFRHIAAVIAAGYVLLLILCGLFARSVGPRPGSFVRHVVSKFVAIPELALHRAIELRALDTRQCRGVILELGCRSGELGSLLIELSPRILALDGIDDTPVDNATLESLGYRRAVSAPLHALPFAKEQYDCVVSIGVLEHTRELEECLREVNRILVPGGVFIFTTPNSRWRNAGLWARLLQITGNVDKAERFAADKDLAEGHVNYLSRGEWTSCLLAAGFGNVSVRPVFSNNQALLYDLLGFQSYMLTFYLYPHIRAFTNYSSKLRDLLIFAVAGLVGTAASVHVADECATHWAVHCERSDALSAV